MSMKAIGKISVFVMVVAVMVLTVACAKDSGTSQSASQASLSQEQSSNINPEDLTTLTGVAVGGAHASIELEDENGDVHYFEYPDLDRDDYDTWQEGDTMVVTYVHNDDASIGDSVVSLHQKNAANSDQNR